MTGFDIAILLLVGLGAVTGFMRGFVQEVLALAAWVISVVLIRSMHGSMSDFFIPLVGSESGGNVLAFAVLLIIPYAMIRVLANRMGELSRNSVLGPLDRLLGFGFGTVKGVLIAVMAFAVLALGYDTVWGAAGRPDWITQSRSYPFINAASEALVQKIANRRSEAVEAEAKRAIKDEAVKQATGKKHKPKD